MKIKLFIIFLLFLIITSSLFLFFGIYSPLQNKETAQEKVFEIKEKEGLFEIARNLEKENLIKSNFLFEFYVILKNDFNSLRRGSYNLNSGMSIKEIAQKIIEGDTIKLKLTFKEGWRIEEMGEYLEKRQILEKKEFIDAAQNYKSDLKILKDNPLEKNLEGYLFPDTYVFEQKISAQKIIDRMVLNLQNKLIQEIGPNLTLEEKNFHEIITMASLIEKEVQTYEDKRLVSGIGWKRIENQIPLQMDATITYLTNKKSSKVSIEETKIDSPYNAYKYKGLPPGPICNPGLESIKAALYPKESEYWYYLSSPTGETIFSENLIQHNTAKIKHLK